MEIEYGASVVDRNGKVLGTVDGIVRDTWSGEIRKFKVGTEKSESDLLFSPEDVLEATPGRVKLKISADEPIPKIEVEYGAEVIDKNGKVLGTVNYIMRDTWTGEISKFKVSTKKAESDLIFPVEDVLEVTVSRIKLKTALDKSG